jgi:transposase-like protein
MTKSKRGRYTLEFKQEAARLVESGQSQAAVARSLGVVEQTLGNWVFECSGGLFDLIEVDLNGARQLREELRSGDAESEEALYGITLRCAHC